MVYSALSIYIYEYFLHNHSTILFEEVVND